MHQSTQTAEPTPDDVCVPCLERRALLRAAGAAAVVGAVGAGLAACGSSGGTTSTAGTPVASSPSDTSTESSAMASSAAPATSSSAAGSGMALGAASQVPVGGGKIFAEQKVVVAQPASGTFKAFSSTCTHQGCQVNEVGGGLIKCPCHGSQFSVTDGSVQAGPAPSPLAAKTVTVQGGQLFLAS